MAFFLNLPWTIVGLLVALTSLPVSSRIERGVLVISSRSLWLIKIFLRGAVGITLGNVVLLSQDARPWVLEHELVHTEQFNAYPFVFPFMYIFELLKSGYRKNRFEIEAYQRVPRA